MTIPKLTTKGCESKMYAAGAKGTLFCLRMIDTIHLKNVSSECFLNGFTPLTVGVSWYKITKPHGKLCNPSA